MFAAIAISANVAVADVIVTRDGNRVEGELRKVDDGWDVVAPDGKITRVRSADVRTIELGNNGSPGMEGLYSLRRSVENTDNIPQILQRYKRFIDQASDPNVIAEAKRDIATWEQRRNDKMVRVGKKWVTRAEQEQAQVEAYTLIDQARQQIRQNDLPAAQKTIENILTLDPRQVAAPYFQGVIAMRQNRLIDARKAFDAVRDQITDHAPTLYNLAVVESRLKQWPAAAIAMNASLGAEPGTQLLIDGAAELLQLIPEESRKLPVIRALATRFAEQDSALARQMQARQMYRWGATWVDKSSYDKLIEADRAAKEKIEKLQGDFDLTENRITRIDTEIRENETAMRNIEARSFTRTADGTVVRLPLPAAYYDLQRQNASLAAERKEMTARLDSLRAAAKRALNDFPVPKYSGVLKPIGEDGVPVILPPGIEPPRPETRPATQPAAPPPPIIRIGPGTDDDENNR